MAAAQRPPRAGGSPTLGRDDVTLLPSRQYLGFAEVVRLWHPRGLGSGVLSCQTSSLRRVLDAAVGFPVSTRFGEGIVRAITWSATTQQPSTPSYAVDLGWGMAHVQGSEVTCPKAAAMPLLESIGSLADRDFKRCLSAVSNHNSTLISMCRRARDEISSGKLDLSLGASILGVERSAQRQDLEVLFSAGLSRLCMLAEKRLLPLGAVSSPSKPRGDKGTITSPRCGVPAVDEPTALEANGDCRKRVRFLPALKNGVLGVGRHFPKCPKPSAQQEGSAENVPGKDGDMTRASRNNIGDVAAEGGFCQQAGGSVLQGDEIPPPKVEHAVQDLQHGPLTNGTGSFEQTAERLLKVALADESLLEDLKEADVSWSDFHRLASRFRATQIGQQVVSSEEQLRDQSRRIRVAGAPQVDRLQMRANRLRQHLMADDDAREKAGQLLAGAWRCMDRKLFGLQADLPTHLCKVEKPSHTSSIKPYLR
mmetsp:Transcript_76890/g.249042  ORF Transcript_76890/g.249042 Transcript_76890/m.249042 type:complete len:479 (-) Transcript_76890:134-1570(-)